MSIRKKGFTSVELYYLRVFNLMFRIVPAVAGVAAACFTFMKISGHHNDVSMITVLVFDVICATYFVIAGCLIRVGITKDGKIDAGYLRRARIVLILCTIVQYNIVTYIFPAREGWVTAAFYVLLSAVLFDSKMVLNEIVGISLSTAVSWIILGEQLLPVQDEQFIVQFVLRIVTLVITFFFCYILTRNAERLLMLAEKDARVLEQENEKLVAMSREVIDFTADLIERRDATSGTHVKRVKDYTRVLAIELSRLCPEYGLTPEVIDGIVEASVLHDVGKILISDIILLKPGKLTAEEFDEIKKHTTYGETIVDRIPESVEESYRFYGKEIAACHHEKYDGRGYPRGLVGEEIPISAQIVSLADCFDALTTDRPYKSAFSVETAYDMIIGGECGVFSDKLITCFGNCKKEFQAIRDRNVSSAEG